MINLLVKTSSRRRGEDRKPHIYLTGSPVTHRRWRCVGQGIVATGYSPESAYSRWKDDLTQFMAWRDLITAERNRMEQLT